MGMQVCAWAGNGSEAIKKAEEQRPNLILLDLCMPVMSGLEAASAIRKAVPDARIIMFTLYSDTFAELLAKAAGVDLVISKSQGVAALLDALEPRLSELNPERSANAAIANSSR